MRPDFKRARSMCSGEHPGRGRIEDRVPAAPRGIRGPGCRTLLGRRMLGRRSNTRACRARAPIVCWASRSTRPGRGGVQAGDRGVPGRSRDRAPPLAGSLRRRGDLQPGARAPEEHLAADGEMHRVLRAAAATPSSPSRTSGASTTGSFSPSVVTDLNPPLGPHVRGYTCASSRRWSSTDGATRSSAGRGAGFYPIPSPWSNPLSSPGAARATPSSCWPEARPARPLTRT